jgi:hypothetical protein
MKTKDLKSVLSKIEKSKNIIGAERDKLRDLCDDLEDLLETYDRGIEGLESGHLEIQNAIDAISELT